jgi:O-acetyl-ADP-ribose deacetylase (regulator of RNase III)
MIRYTTGNLLDAPAEALVNTVNEVGVMGKGIALMFRETFPENVRAYEEAARSKQIRIGRMFVTRNQALVGPRWIINFPTKKHWRHPSKLEWVREGLKDLTRVIRENEIHSVALPPLGCGNGGLEWEQVRREIEAAAAELPDVEFVVFAPTSEYQNAPKRDGVEELTPARALIAELVRRYSVLGLECTNLEVQKLAWFLHRMIGILKLGNPLDLRFAADKYGPYADRLRHLLNGLDGSYLHCEKRLSDAGPFDLIWFEDSKRDKVQGYLRSAQASGYLAAMEKTAEIIDGFESPLGMELLATVDWLVSEGGCTPTPERLRRGLASWPGGKTAARRKIKLFDERLLRLALERLAVLESASTQ